MSSNIGSPTKKRLHELAQIYMDDAPEIPEEAYDDFVDDLQREFDAAIADRWIEWKKAREAGLPLGSLCDIEESS